ncbi:PrpF domain-containing protein [Pseudomonas sp. PP3]|uniref:PrpF domain-containing protein n=1 Tax=Pseudomonas sp. PP3 TaxID=2815936 RepID=UPI001BAFA109|nr:PrpF domain-containing protein [Pseudomonas sp. PP3]
MAQTRIPCVLMRGGTSKGAYFLAQDLPDQPVLCDRVLLAAMGSPDARQIDGIGGGDSLTSKVAIIRQSLRSNADVDYLFAKVIVDEPRVDYGQNCGNILAGVGPFAIERGLVAPPHAGGALSTRSFIPHRCHTSIGVFGAVSVAAACLIPGSVVADLACVGEGTVKHLSIEHPTGEFTVELRLRDGQLVSCGLIRTSRLLFDGAVCIPEALWSSNPVDCTE